MLGLWAADLMGLSGADAEAYAKTVIVADFEEAGDEDVIRKVTADLEGKVESDVIRAKRKECVMVAKGQLAEDPEA